MPPIESVRKQSPNARAATATAARAAPSGGIRSLRKSGWDLTDGLKMLLYGETGSGKTTLASSFPGPILWLICSGGQQPGELKSIDTPELRGKIEPYVLEKPGDLAEFMAEAGDFNTVVLDHVTGYMDLIIAETLGYDHAPIQKSWGMTNQQTWGAMGAECMEALKKLLTFQGNVVIIGHERVYNSKDETGEGSDIIKPRVSAALTPKAIKWLHTAVDYICQTYVTPRFEVQKKKVTATTEALKKVRVVGKYDYWLRTGPDDTYITKFRKPKGKDVPEAIKDPDYDKIMAVIRGEYED